VSELNELRDLDALREAMHRDLGLWQAALVWDAATPARRDAAVEAALQVLTDRRVVAVLQAGVSVPAGTRAELTLPVLGDRVLVHDEDGSVHPGPEPEEIVAALSTQAGARVLDEDEDGDVVRDGDDGEQFAPQPRTTLHYGESDPQLWGVAVSSVGVATLHHDVAVLRGEQGALAAHAVSQAPSAPGPSLTVVDFGSWYALTYYSREAMEAKVPRNELREPTARFTVGLGLSRLPSAPVDTPAGRVATVLAQDLYLPAGDDIEALTAAMSTVRAEQAVASLARCTEDGIPAAAPVAQRPWFHELVDAVEILGFDPAWLRVLDGGDPPVPGEPVTPRGVLDATVRSVATRLRDGGTEPDDAASGTAGTAPEARDAQAPTPEEEPQAAPPLAPGQVRRTAQQRRRANLRYGTAVIAMIVAAFFLFLRPLPWDAADLGVAAVAVVVGVWQLLTAERSR